MKTKAQILLDAAELLRTKGWTQGASARTASGREVDSSHYQACRFCMIGAINRASDNDYSDENSQALRTMWSLVPNEDIAAFNDAPGRTVEECIAVLEKAAQQ